MQEGAGRAGGRRDERGAARWSEVLDGAGQPRPHYAALLAHLESLPRAERRVLEHRMETARREQGSSDWTCDLLPHVFEEAEWSLASRGLRQRMRAFEHFLADLHGAREILHAGAVPIAAVLGSPFFQRAVAGLPPTRGCYLHLGAICLRRTLTGGLEIASQHFGRVHGIARMVQNRRLLARVAPELFRDTAVASIADAPIAVLEVLRAAVGTGSSEPLIVLLSPGPASPHYADDGFLARRMGIPLVQGGDMVVLDDKVWLKTIAGLERVQAILSTVAERYLDPLALDGDSVIGVAGLVHCLRKGTVALVNSLGSQLADDRTLLSFAPRIIRFYLNEAPILPGAPTFWMGDVDQREMVFASPGAYRVLPLAGDALPAGGDAAAARAEVLRAPHLYVAQPAEPASTTLALLDGRRTERTCEHLVFGVRRAGDIEVFPGALTRVLPASGRPHPEALRVFKDAWVHAGATAVSREVKSALAAPRPGRQVITSRVAESLYWLGRHLERAQNLALLLQVIETLEAEELNSSERRLYRPVWNRLLPPLEGTARRGIGSRRDRYRVALQADEPGTLMHLLGRAWRNAEAVREVFSPEVSAVLAELREVFERRRFAADVEGESAGRIARRLAESTTRAIAAFSGLASATMLADDAYRFCMLGQQLERAVHTANATLACPAAFAATQTRETEIELSAFLRLLGTRDNYRRVFQLRVEPLAVLELLWRHPEAPRSVLRCLRECARLLHEIFPVSDTAASGPAEAVARLAARLRGTPWNEFFRAAEPAQPATDDEPPPASAQSERMLARLRESAREVNRLHDVIADVFLNHQARFAPASLRSLSAPDFEI